MALNSRDSYFLFNFELSTLTYGARGKFWVLYILLLLRYHIVTLGTHCCLWHVACTGYLSVALTSSKNVNIMFYFYQSHEIWQYPLHTRSPLHFTFVFLPSSSFLVERWSSLEIGQLDRSSPSEQSSFQEISPNKPHSEKRHHKSAGPCPDPDQIFHFVCSEIFKYLLNVYLPLRIFSTSFAFPTGSYRHYATVNLKRFLYCKLHAQMLWL